MKTSPYLQFILTVIAINLTLLTLKQFDVLPAAYAAGPPNTQGMATDVNLVAINGQSIFNGLVPIVIKDVDTNDKLDVEVRGWQTYDKVPVEVKNNYVYVKNY